MLTRSILLLPNRRYSGASDGVGRLADKIDKNISHFENFSQSPSIQLRSEALRKLDSLYQAKLFMQSDETSMRIRYGELLKERREWRKDVMVEIVSGVSAGYCSVLAMFIGIAGGDHSPILALGVVAGLMTAVRSIANFNDTLNNEPNKSELNAMRAVVDAMKFGHDLEQPIKEAIRIRYDVQV